MTSNNINLSSNAADPACDTNSGSAGIKPQAHNGPIQKTTQSDNESVLRVQEWLNENGFDAGKADGIWGNNSRTAWGDALRQNGDEFWKNPSTPPELRDAIEHLQERGITQFGEDLHAKNDTCIIPNSTLDGIAIPTPLLSDIATPLSYDDAAQPAQTNDGIAAPTPIVSQETYSGLSSNGGNITDIPAVSPLVDVPAEIETPVAETPGYFPDQDWSKAGEMTYQGEPGLLAQFAEATGISSFAHMVSDMFTTPETGSPTVVVQNDVTTPNMMA